MRIHAKFKEPINTINRPKLCIAAVFLFLLLFAAIAGIYDFAVPEVISVYNTEPIPSSLSMPFVEIVYEEPSVAALASASQSAVQSLQAEAKLFGVLPIKNVEVNVYDKLTLYPGGMTFGVKFYTHGVLVVGMSDITLEDGSVVNPSYEAGLRIKDIITKVNGVEVNTVDEVTMAIESSGGQPLSLTITRNREELILTLTPAYSSADNLFKAGLWIRDSTAGIGTITFINPKDNSFAGLGHGICDVDTGELMPLLHGTVTHVTLSGINRGKAGAPGELKGYFSAGKIGVLLGNTNAGVFGMLNDIPSNVPCEPLPIALKSEIKEGDATIYCTNDMNEVKQYHVRISNMNRDTADAKSFIVEVTDPALIELTGGIVQGMSGSPIIQNGKLIGAVTHVLINDPTRGYGIFIENMLAAME